MRPVSATLSTVASASTVAAVIATPLACTVIAVAMTTGACTYIGLIVYTALRACRPSPADGNHNAYNVLQLLLPWASGRRNFDISEDGSSDLYPQQLLLSHRSNSAPSVSASGTCPLTARKKL
jgi:hypothetical protein